MINVLRHSRGVFIGLAALGLSASLALAGQPAVTGPSNAASQGGQTEGTDASEAPEATEAPDASEAPDTSETPDANSSTTDTNCTTDPTTLSPEQLAAATHGSIVCWAAHQPTPDGYANHGAWVKHWAQLKFDANGVAIPKTKHDKGSASHP